MPPRRLANRVRISEIRRGWRFVAVGGPYASLCPEELRGRCDALFVEEAEETWPAFRSRMYDGDFVLSVDRDFVRSCETPMLVLMGDDLYHPQVTSREVAALAPNAELIEHWKEEDVLRETVARVRSFLEANTP